MAKENENLESTEETVEEVVADKDTEQEQLNVKKKKRKALPSPVKKRKKKLNVLKLRKLVMLLKQVQVLPSSEVLSL